MTIQKAPAIGAAESMTPAGMAAPGALLAVIHELGPRFAAAAAANDESDAFVAENIAALKAAGLAAVAVPAELGGGGASHAELCAALRALAGYCASTALAFSMHSHQVALAAWRWRHQKPAPIEALLKWVAAENILLLTSGGSDWLPSSGTAERVEGGFRVSARKVFASGAPAANLYSTSAVYDDPEAGPTVLHFSLPIPTKGLEILPTWRSLGMRATASHDMLLKDVFVADAAVSLKRPKGKWHPILHLISMIALPAVYSVYLGLAEAARDLTLRQVARRGSDPRLISLVGELETELAAARLAVEDMIATAATSEPGVATTNRIMIGRNLAARAVLKTVDIALDAAGGAGFSRSFGLERLFRDAQAARYHPMPDSVQRDFTGRVALGLSVDG